VTDPPDVYPPPEPRLGPDVWQVCGYDLTDVHTVDSPLTLPEGWEPIAVTEDTVVVLRRLAP